MTMQKIGILKKFAIAMFSAMAIWGMGTSSAFALYHDEWWTYFFRNSKTWELASFYIAWDAYGGVFEETTAKLFSKDDVPTKNVYPEWDYVGYGHFNRWASDCYLLPEIGGLKYSSNHPVLLRDDECTYPKRNKFELRTLVGGIWYFQAWLCMIAYLSPTLFLVTFYVFFAGQAICRLLGISKFLPVRYASVIAPVVFWLYGWDFLYGAKYDQFDGFIYLLLLMGALPFFFAWFSSALARGKFVDSRFSWMVWSGIVQISVFFLLLFCMRETGWAGVVTRFTIAVTFAILVSLAFNLGYLILQQDGNSGIEKEKSPS